MSTTTGDAVAYEVEQVAADFAIGGTRLDPRQLHLLARYANGDLSARAYDAAVDGVVAPADGGVVRRAMYAARARLDVGREPLPEPFGNEYVQRLDGLLDRRVAPPADERMEHGGWHAPQVEREGAYRRLHDPVRWADRAAVTWQALQDAGRGGDQGRTARAVVDQLARAAGHRVDWRAVLEEFGTVAGERGTDMQTMRRMLRYGVTGVHSEPPARARKLLEAVDELLGDERGYLRMRHEQPTIARSFGNERSNVTGIDAELTRLDRKIRNRLEKLPAAYHQEPRRNPITRLRRGSRARADRSETRSITR